MTSLDFFPAAIEADLSDLYQLIILRTPCLSRGRIYNHHLALRLDVDEQTLPAARQKVSELLRAIPKEIADIHLIVVVDGDDTNSIFIYHRGLDVAELEKTIRTMAPRLADRRWKVEILDYPAPRVDNGDRMQTLSDALKLLCGIGGAPAKAVQA